MSNLSEQKLITIVPSSISGDKTIRNISAATDPGLRKISRDTLLLLLLPRLDELPEKSSMPWHGSTMLISMMTQLRWRKNGLW